MEETFSEEMLKKMSAPPPKVKDIKVLTHDKIDEMKNADGFLFGMPTRFG